MYVPDWKKRKMGRTEYLLTMVRESSAANEEGSMPPTLLGGTNERSSVKEVLGSTSHLKISERTHTDTDNITQYPGSEINEHTCLEEGFFINERSLAESVYQDDKSYSEMQNQCLMSATMPERIYTELKNVIPGSSLERAPQQNSDMDSSSDTDFSVGSSDVYIPETSSDEISNSPSPLPLHPQLLIPPQPPSPPQPVGCSSNVCIPESSSDEISNSPSPSPLLPQLLIPPQPPSPPQPTVQNNTPAQTNEEKPKTRKRLRNPNNWTKNKIKNNRNLGEAYINSRGQEIPKRKVQNTCSEKCRLKCPTKIDNETRQEIHKCYWKLGDVNRQRDFLVGHMQPVVPKYAVKKPGSTRSNNFAYYFNVCDINIRVCKTYFINTLDISSDVIITAQKKKTSEGFVEKDKRGGYPNAGRARIDEDVKIFARKHIEAFPVMEAHYCRARTEKQYIQGNLTLSEMYRQYLIKCTENDSPPLKKHMYETLFNTEYNISFYKPKKDACRTCQNYENMSATEKLEKQDEFNSHIHEKEKSRIEKENGVRNSSQHTTVSCFDLQAVITVPEGSRNDFFYKRRLSCFNFTIFDIKEKQGYSYFWHEGIARRGVNEIGSCLYLYLKDSTNKKVIFYSDNCPCQNKNKFIMALYLFCVRNMDIDSITHKFFIVDHSQNEGDSMHAMIEKEKKRALKAGPQFVPTQLLPIISMPKKNGNPYRTNESLTFLILRR